MGAEDCLLVERRRDGFFFFSYTARKQWLGRTEWMTDEGDAELEGANGFKES